MTCQLCKQGNIVEIRINTVSQTVFKCEECDAAWFTEKEIGLESGFQLGPYLRRIGITEYIAGQVTKIRTL